MKNHLRSIMLAAAIAVGLSNWAVSGVVLSFSPLTTSTTVPTTGTTKQIIIEASIAADVGTQDIRGYNLPVDISPPVDIGMPTGWSITTVNVINEIAGDPPFSFSTTPTQGDLFVQDATLFGSAVTLTTAPLPSFNFTLELTDQAQQGNYTVGIFNGATFAVVDGGGAGIAPAQIQSNTATITLTAVPEPATGSLTLLAVLGCSLCRRRRQA